MQVTANQVFLHGGVRYERGEVYDVAPDVAGWFVAAGWADCDEIPAPVSCPAGSVTLEPHDVVQGQEAPHG